MLEDLSGVTVGNGQASQPLDCRTGADAQNREDCRIVAYVNSIQDYWDGQMRGYRESPDRVLHRSDHERVRAATTDVGPFYCPGDSQGVHRPRVLPGAHDRFGAQGGPLARGVRPGARVRPPRPGPARASSARSADGAGAAERLRAHSSCRPTATRASGRRTPSTPATSRRSPMQDVADALDAAAAVGDDRIQRETQGRSTARRGRTDRPRNASSGSPAGYPSGNPNDCDTFSGSV